MVTLCRSSASVYPTQEGIPVQLQPMHAEAGQCYLSEGPVRARTGPYQNVRSPLYVKGPDGLKPLPQSVEMAVLTGTIGVVLSVDEHALEERKMLTLRKQVVALFVDRQSQQWIVRDPEGNFWIVPSVENAWDHRQPFQPSEEADLEPVPGHYKDMLGLPF